MNYQGTRLVMVIGDLYRSSVDGQVKRQRGGELTGNGKIWRRPLTFAILELSSTAVIMLSGRSVRLECPTDGIPFLTLCGYCSWLAESK